MHTDSRYADACDRASRHTPWIIDACGGAHAAWVAKKFAAFHAAAGTPEGENVCAMGIEDSIELREFRELERAFSEAKWKPRFAETDGFVKKMRAVKDERELSAMRAAQAITDAAFEHIVEFMSEGMTELEVKRELEETMRRLGAEGLAFDSIVASGPNGAAPHSIAGERRLQAGDMVVMLDFGARAGGYCSDMTRTVCLGEPDARSARQALRGRPRRRTKPVEAALRPGRHRRGHASSWPSACWPTTASRARWATAWAMAWASTSTSCPTSRRATKRRSMAGNVVTVEPGVYLPGEFGMRLEDFGVVTEEGFRSFHSIDARHGYNVAKIHAYSRTEQRCPRIERNQRWQSLLPTSERHVHRVQRQAVHHRGIPACEARQGRRVRSHEAAPTSRPAACVDYTFNAGVKFDSVRLEHEEDAVPVQRRCRFLLHGQRHLPTQTAIPADRVGDAAQWLKENDEATLLYAGDELISIEPQMFVELEVTAHRARLQGRHGHEHHQARHARDRRRACRCPRSSRLATCCRSTPATAASSSVCNRESAVLANGAFSCGAS